MTGSQGQPCCALCHSEQGEVTGWDMWHLHRLQIAHKNFAKISLARKQVCPVCTIMIILATFKNIMKQKGSYIDIYVVHVFPRMVRSMFTVL